MRFIADLHIHSKYSERYRRCRLASSSGSDLTHAGWKYIYQARVDGEYGKIKIFGSSYDSF